MNRNRLLLVLGSLAILALAWSAVRPYDYAVWLFEISLGVVGIGVLAATYRRFPFSNLVYVLVLIHWVILVVGAKYTYAEMPLFNWLRDHFGWSRNHFDRIGHFAQGFTPAIIVREFLLRKSALKPGKLLFFLTVCACLALSAVYELLEMWMVIVLYPSEGPAWLGLQGDPWDAQWDMTMALFGAITAYLFLRRVHDWSMAVFLDERTPQ